MFDDHLPQQSGQPPHNLPIANDAEDMFSGTASLPAAAPSAPISPPPPPPSAAPVSAVSAGVLKPKVVLDDPLALDDTQAAADTIFPSSAPVSSVPDTTIPAPMPVPVSPPPNASSAGGNGSVLPPLATVPPAVNMDGADTSQKLPANLYAIKEPKTGRFLFIAVVSFVGLIIFLAVVWWIYTQFVHPADPVVTDTSTNIILPTANDDRTGSSLNGIDNSLSGSQVDDTVLFGQPVDTDGDGLDDEREASVGTDMNNWDTDGDLLSDGDEVIIWKTNPLNVDTDGDGFGDGTEVKGGYSPTGPGKIFEPPTSDGNIPSAVSSDTNTTATTTSTGTTTTTTIDTDTSTFGF